MAGSKSLSSGQKPKGSSWRRTSDYVYAFFFILHIVIMFMVDLVPLYPDALKPAFLDDIRSFYINTYQDKFFIDPPAWFGSYIVMELVYHVPASIINASKLLNDDSSAPLHVLVWAIQTFVTTFTCVVEVWSWADRTTDQKMNISLLYVPYMIFAGLVGLDMFVRLESVLKKLKRD
ncbi:hypothetical protein TESG_03999 [Trichophyton tonsurans CBS 112818]|uniref:Efficient mitochondria targeting-associated protein 19 n=2 Tax=Trichophyton TaxID=5550 RepID=F2Q225_TRIEC|nr:hypothetical protein TESG_03999 [Trichophyton tonsurans CBS 112818]EGE08193.1 integral membrane protein [Trichophyton equinum CBS 127.97]